MKNIYSLIHDNLKKMLIVSLSAAAIILLIYAVLSVRQSERQAAEFVMNHVESLVEAGVNSQDVNGIDKEIGRFAKTWKDTQELELRVDVFLDEKKVGHTGQLQPFQYFYSTTAKELKLPSGHMLRVEIQLEFLRFIFSSLILLLIFEVSIVAAFYVLMRSIKASIRRVTEPLESKVAVLKKIAQNLPDSARDYKDSAITQITEIDELGHSIGSLTAQITDLYDRLVKVTIDRERVRMAEQVAHNIKSVIATLQLKVSALPISSKEKTDLLGAADSLRDISSELLKSKKEERNRENIQTTESATHLLPITRTVVAAKQAQCSEAGNFHIEIENECDALGCFAKISSGELQSILSNLIDNAIEAMPSGGKIGIGLRRRDAMIEISVSDTGKGIPPHVIPALTNEGFSHEKPDGNGIGLFHAKAVMDAIGGSLKIESAEGEGTTIKLSFPSAIVEHGMAMAIEIPPGASVICVDDDPLVHKIWDIRLADLDITSIVHLSSAKEFEAWMKDHEHGVFGSRLYLFDCELKGEEKTGLCLIGEYGLALESILVSGLASDAQVALRAREMGVKRLSKDFLDSVPIRLKEQPRMLEVV